METWKRIAGFEDYEVSNLGRVKRVTLGRGTSAVGGIKKLQVNIRSGYIQINLSKKSKKYRKPVHRLVALAFIANPENLPQVNHKDGVKANNKVQNLEWCTRQQNMTHGSKLGLFGEGVSLRKSNGRWRAKYSPEPNKVVWLGTFSSFEEAKSARDKKMKELK